MTKHYMVRATIPVYVHIVMDDDGKAEVTRVSAGDDEIAATLDDAHAEDPRSVGTYDDPEPHYIHPGHPHWPALAAAWDETTWPSWDFGS